MLTCVNLGKVDLSVTGRYLSYYLTDSCGQCVYALGMVSHSLDISDLLLTD